MDNHYSHILIVRLLCIIGVSIINQKKNIINQKKIIFCSKMRLALCELVAFGVKQRILRVTQSVVV
jgi:hypothetical protein